MNELIKRTETGVVVPTIHAKCSGCFKTVGHQGPRENMIQLLELQGWMIGSALLCPGCVAKRAKRVFRKLQDEEEGDRW